MHVLLWFLFDEPLYLCGILQARCSEVRTSQWLQSSSSCSTKTNPLTGCWITSCGWRFAAQKKMPWVVFWVKHSGYCFKFVRWVMRSHLPHVKENLPSCKWDAGEWLATENDWKTVRLQIASYSTDLVWFSICCTLSSLKSRKTGSLVKAFYKPLYHL